MAKTLDETPVKLPFYARISLILVGLFVFLSMLSLGRSIIVPLLFATILSILLSTLVDFLERRKMDRVLAISIAVGTALLLGILLTIAIISRASAFFDSLPLLMARLDELQVQFVGWLSENFNVNGRKTNAWITTARQDLLSFSGERLGNTITALGNAIVILILVPVYIFLMLYYQPLLIDFIHTVVGNGHDKDVGAVLGDSRTILKAYFGGLTIELGIVAVLNSIGLLALGIDYAILIGITGALLNLIPYIGGMVMLGLSMLMALLSKGDPVYALYAAGLFFLIQTIDNYYLIPKIVGSKVKINALVAIVAVIAGGALWGIAGMFLAIPLTAIIKVIFDRIKPLQPWGFLLGDTMPPMVRIKLRRRRIQS